MQEMCATKQPGRALIILVLGSGKKPLAGFWKAVQPAQLPMRGDANQSQPGHCSPQNWGLAVYAHQPWPLSKRSFGHLELKSKHWGFEKCSGLSQLMDIAHENGQFLDPNGSSGATTTRGWVTLEGQAPLSRARQTTVGVHTD